MCYKLKRKLGYFLFALCCASCSSAKDPVITGSFLPNRGGDEAVERQEERTSAYVKPAQAKPAPQEEKIIVNSEAKTPKAVVAEVEAIEKKTEMVVEEGQPIKTRASAAGLETISKVDNRAALIESESSVANAGKAALSGRLAPPVRLAPLEKSKAGMQWFDEDASENKSAFISDTIDKNSAERTQLGDDTARKSDVGLEYLQQDADETFVVYISKAVGVVPADK